jgi:hypothetical protein
MAKELKESARPKTILAYDSHIQKYEVGILLHTYMFARGVLRCGGGGGGGPGI